MSDFRNIDFKNQDDIYSVVSFLSNLPERDLNVFLKSNQGETLLKALKTSPLAKKPKVKTMYAKTMEDFKKIKKTPKKGKKEEKSFGLFGAGTNSEEESW